MATGNTKGTGQETREVTEEIGRAFFEACRNRFPK
jgi:hypothetical protein